MENNRLCECELLSPTSWYDHIVDYCNTVNYLDPYKQCTTMGIPENITFQANYHITQNS